MCDTFHSSLDWNCLSWCLRLSAKVESTNSLSLEDSMEVLHCAWIQFSQTVLSKKQQSFKPLPAKYKIIVNRMLIVIARELGSYVSLTISCLKGLCHAI